CAEPALRLQSQKVNGTPAGEGTLVISFDPGAVGQPGCTVTASIESDDAAEAFALGKVVRLPRIDGFSLSDERAGNGFTGILRGFDLETIEKTGWDARTGIAVPELPRPIAGEGAKQSLRIAMPWPSPTPKSPLFVWLRGETEGRATKVTQ